MRVCVSVCVPIVRNLFICTNYRWLAIPGLNDFQRSTNVPLIRV